MFKLDLCNYLFIDGREVDEGWGEIDSNLLLKPRR